MFLTVSTIFNSFRSCWIRRNLARSFCTDILIYSISSNTNKIIFKSTVRSSSISPDFISIVTFLRRMLHSISSSLFTCIFQSIRRQPICTLSTSILRVIITTFTNVHILYLSSSCSPISIYIIFIFSLFRIMLYSISSLYSSFISISIGRKAEDTFGTSVCSVFIVICTYVLAFHFTRRATPISIVGVAIISLFIGMFFTISSLLSASCFSWILWCSYRE